MRWTKSHGLWLALCLVECDPPCLHLWWRGDGGREQNWEKQTLICLDIKTQGPRRKAGVWFLTLPPAPGREHHTAAALAASWKGLAGLAGHSLACLGWRDSGLAHSTTPQEETSSRLYEHCSGGPVLLPASSASEGLPGSPPRAHPLGIEKLRMQSAPSPDHPHWAPASAGLQTEHRGWDWAQE